MIDRRVFSDGEGLFDRVLITRSEGAAIDLVRDRLILDLEGRYPDPAERWEALKDELRRRR